VTKGEQDNFSYMYTFCEPTIIPNEGGLVFTSEFHQKRTPI